MSSETAKKGEREEGGKAREGRRTRGFRTVERYKERTHQIQVARSGWRIVHTEAEPAIANQPTSAKEIRYQLPEPHEQFLLLSNMPSSGSWRCCDGGNVA
jgi:hypothetical protein